MPPSTMREMTPISQRSAGAMPKGLPKSRAWKSRKPRVADIMSSPCANMAEKRTPMAVSSRTSRREASQEMPSTVSRPAPNAPQKRLKPRR